jgi:hypothetical protein
VKITPGWRRSESCMPQKRPQARIARMVDAVMSLLLLLSIEQLAVGAVAFALELVKGNEA